MNDVRKLCTNLRSVAGHNRALIHYNGHGVPRPTANGEIWVFNSVSPARGKCCCSCGRLLVLLLDVVLCSAGCFAPGDGNGYGVSALRSRTIVHPSLRGTCRSFVARLNVHMYQSRSQRVRTWKSPFQRPSSLETLPLMQNRLPSFNLPTDLLVFFLFFLARAYPPVPPSLPPADVPPYPVPPDLYLGTPAHDKTQTRDTHPSALFWSFLQSYTQYIPLSVHQLKEWAGTPAIFVLDCSAAGVLLKHFVEPQPPMEEGEDVISPDTPPRGDGGGGAAGAGGLSSDMSERLSFFGVIDDF